MNSTQKNKRNFRASKRWKEFRHRKNVEQKGKCYISGRKLLKTANLHHLDLNPNNYEDLSKPENYVFLSHSMHEVVHTLYSSMEHNGFEVMERLLHIIDKMYEINKPGEMKPGEYLKWKLISD